MVQGRLDFGVTDMLIEEYKNAFVEKDLKMLPLFASAVVFVYNIPDVKGLRMDRESEPQYQQLPVFVRSYW
jgi:hypothetical protein